VLPRYPAKSEMFQVYSIIEQLIQIKVLQRRFITVHVCANSLFVFED